MENAFQKISEPKRSLLVNAGLKEFSTHGRTRSSLNRVLKESTVSKGVFYYHFVDKDDFFKKLMSYSGDLILMNMDYNHILSETDFIERLILTGLAKHKISLQYKDIFPYMIKFYQEYPHSEIELLSTKESQEFSARVLSENLDFNNLKEGVEISTAMTILGRYLSQLSIELSPRWNNMSNKEVREYYETEIKSLRDLLYNS